MRSIRTFLAQFSSLNGVLKTLSAIVVGVFISYFSQLILARILDIRIYGEFITQLSIANIFISFSSFGLGMSVVRFIPHYEALSDFLRIKGYVLFSLRVLIFSGLFCLVLFFILFFLGYKGWFFIIIPFLGAHTYFNSYLKAVGQSHVANIMEPSLRSGIFILLVLALLYFFLLLGQKSVAIQVWHLIFLFSLSLGVLIFFQYQLTVSRIMKLKIFPLYEIKKWVQVSIPMSFIAGSYLLFSSIDVLAVRYFLDSRSVAIYYVSMKLASMALLVNSAVKMVVAPRISKFFTEGRMSDVALMNSQGTILSVSFSLIFFFFLVVFGKDLLFIYGHSFSESYVPMLILLGGFCIAISFGLLDTLLMMTCYEKGVVFIYIGGVLLNLILNPLFIFLWGLNGAAIATAVAIVVQSFVMMLMVYFKLSFFPACFVLKRFT